jgi:ribonuclease HI
MASNGGGKVVKPVTEEYDPGLYGAGTGPLPPGAIDGFDPNILLDPRTGEVVYKRPTQKNATKLQAVAPSPDSMLRVHTDGSSLGNGKVGAMSGVGVYFGPMDER